MVRHNPSRYGGGSVPFVLGICLATIPASSDVVVSMLKDCFEQSDALRIVGKCCGSLFPGAVAIDWFTHAHVEVLQADAIFSVWTGWGGLQPHGSGIGSGRCVKDLA